MSRLDAFTSFQNPEYENVVSGILPVSLSLYVHRVVKNCSEMSTDVSQE
jgi:hypothetical protein